MVIGHSSSIVRERPPQFACNRIFMVLLSVLQVLGCGGISAEQVPGGIMPLTDVKVRNADPKQKAYRIPDAKGLHLFVTPSGGKLWRWKYRFNGAQKLMALGKYPEVPL